MATAAGTLSMSEIEQARMLIEQSRKLLVGATALLTEEQWSFRAAPDQWSIAEIVEHVVLVQERIAGVIGKAETGAGVSSDAANAETIDRLVILLFPTRMSKFKGPQIVMPAGNAAPAESLARFAKNCAIHRELLESRRDLRRMSIPAPPLKSMSGGQYETMDGYQWILGVAGHTERHVKQILEVIAEPRFPR